MNFLLSLKQMIWAIWNFAIWRLKKGVFKSMKALDEQSIFVTGQQLDFFQKYDSMIFLSMKN